MLISFSYEKTGMQGRSPEDKYGLSPRAVSGKLAEWKLPLQGTVVETPKSVNQSRVLVGSFSRWTPALPLTEMMAGKGRATSYLSFIQEIPIKGLM